MLITGRHIPHGHLTLRMLFSCWSCEMCNLMAEICWSNRGESFTSPGPGKAPGACPGVPPVNVTERHQSWLQRLKTGSSLTPPLLKAHGRSLMLSPVPVPKASVNPSQGSLYLAVVLLCAGEPVGEQKEREGIRQCGSAGRNRNSGHNTQKTLFLTTKPSSLRPCSATG